MQGNAATEAGLAGIEAFERLVTLDPGARFEGEIVSRGVSVFVTGPRGEAEGRLSALWLLAARATARAPGVAQPSLRFPIGVNEARPEDLNRAVALPLFQAALFFADAGDDDEALLCLRRATHGCATHAGWRQTTKLPEALLAKAPKRLLARAGDSTRLEREIGDFDGSASALAKRVLPFASDADMLVRHDCAAYLTWAARSIQNSSAAPFAKQVAPALAHLLRDPSEYVREQALAAAEFTAQALAAQAETWRRSHKARLAAVAALGPLATELAELGVNREHQTRRLALDGTPLPPPAGTEKGPWAKEVLEARAILAERARHR